MYQRGQKDNSNNVEIPVNLCELQQLIHSQPYVTLRVF